MMDKKLVHFVEWKKISDTDIDSVLEDLCSWGVTDLVAHPVWGLREHESPGYLGSIAGKLAAYNLRTPACHAFWNADFDLGCTDETRRREAMKEHSEFLFQLTPMGVKSYTLHLGFGAGEDRTGVWSRIRRSVDELLPAAEETKIVLALENGAESVDELRQLANLVEEYAHPQVGICFDSGHANCYSEAGLMGTLDILKPHIVTCHIHDNYGTCDDHNPPGGGNTDWGELIPLLKSCPRLLHAETESGDWGEASWRKFRQVWEN